MAIVPRWEWRAFGDSFGDAEQRLAESSEARVEESGELYLVSSASDSSVKLRDGLIDVKVRLAVEADGLEQWKPVLKTRPPLDDSQLTALFDDALLVRPPCELRLLPVRKRRARHTVGGCMAELSTFDVGTRSIRTLAVEHEDPDLVRATVRDLGLADRPVVCVARDLKSLVGLGIRCFAVIDVGTNSVKFCIGERQPDGNWRMLADRAEVTRLGEGLGDSGRLGAEPVERTAAAIAAMADEARATGAETIAAVATAGMRVASNAGELIDTVRARSGVEIEVIAGDEEARLAYLGVMAALPDTSGSLVVFDTGGGSSQFTFGHDERVDERFSVNVGAARFTERFGLDSAVSGDVIADARAAIAGELHRLEDGPRPDRVVGMGGAVTNMTAVMHGLAEYDPDVVQGSVLERAEVERQIELYRTRPASERHTIPGLQPGRAEVILAGACVVATVLDLLGANALTVSVRGLRHGVLAERFGS